ncbi:MAG TPA: GNAT family N-acetyltransferase [Verrucomicrobiae bacterium]
MQEIQIRIAETDEDIFRCFSTMRELRPHLQAENFLETIRQFQASGYFLVMLEAGGDVGAVAGCRFSEHLARGKFLYVDDLVTRTDLRRSGHGQKLFEWLVILAETSGCRELHLDSGVQRADAHSFYEKQKMIFASRHYSLKLKP